MMKTRGKENILSGGLLKMMKNGFLPWAAFALAVAWLAAPAVQYFATAQRTGVQLGEGAPYESLASWDLTRLYAVLLAATALFAGLRAMAGRH
jgi:hypothetical protein